MDADRHNQDSQEEDWPTGDDASKTGKNKRVIIVSVGGPTCSGKTTLCTGAVGTGSDYVTSSIDWLRLRDALRQLRQDPDTPLPPSHDGLNPQPDVPVEESQFASWIPKFKELGPQVKFVLLDGFLLYWDRECVAEYDVKLFVRESHYVLKERRRIRQMYYTADGQTWVDPPGYWDNIIWPAYRLAHKHMFVNEDPVSGELDPSSWVGSQVVLLQPTHQGLGEATMSTFVNRALEAIYQQAVQQ